MSRLRFVSAVVAGLVVLVGLVPTAALAGQSANGVQVSSAVRHDVSPPLRGIYVAAPSAANLTERPLYRLNVGRGSPDGAVQATTGTNASVTGGLGFEGLGLNQYGFSMQYAPPDTNGAVGATQYVQWVNAMFAVFNKSTGQILPGFPKFGNAIWAGFGGGCETNNNGDPIAQYDKIANRWILTQFSVSTTPYLQCVAVSTTSDATGTYNRYAFSYGNSTFNDYPKLGVWPDGYYVSYNMFTNFFVGAKVCAFDRTAMLAGGAATQQCFQLSSAYGGLLPSDLDGASSTLQPGGAGLPPAGSPNLFVNFGSNVLNVWKFHVDWANSANTTLSGPTAVSVASFAAACSGGGTCVPQPGTSQKLDSLGDRLMYRLAYRHFADGHEALVVNQSVAVGSTTSVRWYELRNATGHTLGNAAPVVNQQSTLSAADGIHRWMGSIAMDKTGDMALGYSGSNSSVYPSVRLTGRLSTDAANTMQAETILRAGSGSQLPNLSRWGDYSAMTVDPVDDCTFWYTSEYLKTNGTWNWNTWITSFTFSACTGGTSPGSLVGTVTDATSHAAISGASVALTGGASTTTDSTGHYSISGLTPGGYTVTASASGYNPSSTGVTIASGGTTTQDFALTATGGGATVPGQPAAPAASPGPGHGLTVTWTAPSDGGSPITSYLLNRYSGTSCGTLSATFNVGNVLKYKDNSTTKGVAYCYAVSATNSVGTGPLSAKSAPVTPIK